MQNTEAIRVGTEVVDRDGDKIGTVEDVVSNYLLVSKGLIFPKDIFVPLSAVDSVDVDSGYARLNVDKDEIESLGWDEAPVAEGTTTTADAGYVGTQTSYGGSDVEYDEERAATGDALRVPVREEQLRAETVQQQAGEVELRKDVVEEEQTLDVPVSREEVEVRRYAVDRPANDTDVVDTGDTIRVPVTAERVNVDKDVRVAEEIEISKRPVTETQRVTDTVRREEIDVEGEGDVNVTGDATRSRGTRR